MSRNIQSISDKVNESAQNRDGKQKVPTTDISHWLVVVLYNEKGWRQFLFRFSTPYGMWRPTPAAVYQLTDAISCSMKLTFCKPGSFVYDVF